MSVLPLIHNSPIHNSLLAVHRFPDALFWDTASPYYYLRLDRHRDYDYAIFGGEDRKTGQAADTEQCYCLLQLNGEQVAACRDDDGKVTLLSPICTHMGCRVDWNEAERTWDCPCHGSRFKPNGEVLTGPAESPLEKRPQHA